MFMMYGLSDYATGSSLPIGSWLLPVGGVMGVNNSQCMELGAFLSSPVYYLAVILYLATWILILATLVALIRYLWRRAGHY